jgi:hypothetical protein
MVLKKLSQMLPISLALMLSVVSGSLLVAVTASATQPNSTSKKVFVCKYVGKPGVDERLQTGQNPISVSVHAIQHNGWNGMLPGWFSDAQGRSYVIAYDNGQAKPDASTCPKPEVPATPGQGGSTTTTPQVLGTSTTAPSAALPTAIPSTGSAANKALLIILASLAAYGAAYFLQGRRKQTQEV